MDQVLEKKNQHKSIFTPTFQVSYSYSVYFDENIFDTNNSTFCNILESSSLPARILLSIDEGFHLKNKGFLDHILAYFKSHGECIQLIGPIEIFPGGEESKNNPINIQRAYDFVLNYGLDRHSYIVGIGGGAFLDMLGFAAATAHRGIRFVRIPTTVLAQNDAAIGVKNAINYKGRKNFIGTFSPPFAVLNDYTLLSSLSEAEKRAGFAEAIKVSLIRDSQFFDWIEQNLHAISKFEDSAIEHLIQNCCKLHLNQITTGGDPFEAGSARPLDFGHWSAHKLEEISENRIKHGEAVACGIAIDTIYSKKMNILTESDCERVLSVLTGLGFPLVPDELLSLDIVSALNEFQEHLGGKLCITLISACGTAYEVDTIDITIMQQSIRELAEYAKMER